MNPKGGPEGDTRIMLLQTKTIRFDDARENGGFRDRVARRGAMQLVDLPRRADEEGLHDVDRLRDRLLLVHAACRDLVHVTLHLCAQLGLAQVKAHLLVSAQRVREACVGGAGATTRQARLAAAARASGVAGVCCAAARGGASRTR